jgi:hypothetical protein
MSVPFRLATSIDDCLAASQLCEKGFASCNCHGREIDESRGKFLTASIVESLMQALGSSYHK